MDSDRRDLVINSFIFRYFNGVRALGVEWNGVIFDVRVYMETSIDEPQDQPNGKGRQRMRTFSQKKNQSMFLLFRNFFLFPHFASTYLYSVPYWRS